MAERRMFAKTIIDSDLFIDMPTSTRLLYYDLNMRADDDGFVDSPKKIIRMTGASVDDLKMLILKNFLIPFESGVVVIRHWKIHNYIQKDRYKETLHIDEKTMLSTKENKEYVLDTECIQNGYQTDTQVRLDKVRSGKNRSGNNNSTNVQQMSDKSTPEIELEKELEIEKEKERNINKGAKAPDEGKPSKKSNKKKDNTIYYPDDKELNDTVIDFIEFRKNIKAPMTDRAVQIMVNKLNSMTDDRTEKIRILEQSMLNSWKGIFPLKGDSNYGYKGKDAKDKDNGEDYSDIGQSF